MPRHSKVHALGACVIALLAASTAFAQVAPGGALTLQAAMDRAFSANPTIAAARLRGAIDLANLAVAEERLNPSAAIEISKETPKQSFGFAVPLELGGKRAKRIAVGEATVRAGEAEIAATVAQVRNDVRRAYYGVVVADARLMLLNEMRDIAARVRDTAQQRFEAGSAPRLEVMQAQLTRASAENEATAAQGNAVAARAQLNALLGQPLETVTSLIDRGRCRRAGDDRSCHDARADCEHRADRRSIGRSRRSAPESCSLRRFRCRTSFRRPCSRMTRSRNSRTGGAPASQ